MAAERTLILVKPDAFERRLTGEVIARFERKGMSLVALKQIMADEAIANEHYAEHSEKPFFGELVSFITGGPLVAMVLEGPNAIKAARQVIGATDPVEADAGSIRGDLRHRGHLQPRARLRLARVRRARNGDLVPGNLSLPDRPRLALAAAPGTARGARRGVRGRGAEGRGAGRGGAERARAGQRALEGRVDRGHGAARGRW